jgi:hypothetical protein
MDFGTNLSMKGKTTDEMVRSADSTSASFCGFADRVNSLLEETIRAGLFVQERELVFTVAHRFNAAAELLKEVKTWTGTTVPPLLVRRIKRSVPPFEVHEDTRLRRLRVL